MLIFVLQVLLFGWFQDVVDAKKGGGGGIAGGGGRGTGGRYYGLVGDHDRGNSLHFLWSLVCIPILAVGLLLMNKFFLVKRQRKFLEAVARASEEVSASHHQNATSIINPTSNKAKKKKTTAKAIDLSNGNFTATYNDASRWGNATFSSNGVIHFVRDLSSNNNDNQLYSISGHGKDHDGDFVVVQGKVSLLVGNCYWIQEAPQEKEGDLTTTRKKTTCQRCRQWFQQRRAVLVTGTFSCQQDEGSIKTTSTSPSSSSFLVGQWTSNNGTNGEFIEFRVR